MAGLGAAVACRRAGCEVIVLERSERVGGLAYSFSEDGYVYSIGPHFLESSLADKVPGLREACFETEYVEEIFIAGRLRRFPTGLVREPRLVAGVALATLSKLMRRAPTSLAEHLAYHYGAGFGGGVLRPLLEKWAGRPAEEVSVDLAKRLDPPSLQVLLHHAQVLLSGRSQHLDPRRGVWMYPKRGTQAIAAGIVQDAGLDVRPKTDVTRIPVEGGRARGVETSGEPIEADAIVSTMPISAMHRVVAGTDAFDPYRALRFRPVMLVFVRLAVPRVTRYQWVWFPESRFAFYRISESKNIHASFAPASSTMITFELPCELGDADWTASDDALGRRMFEQLREVYPMPTSAYLGATVFRAPAVYPIFLTATEALHRQLEYRSAVPNLYLAGRFGLFRYLMMEESYDSGMTSGALLARSLDAG
jgi:protoporphyrinogen oxidase